MMFRIGALSLAFACLLAGCAGALGVYVPGSGNKSGTFQTRTPIGAGLAKVQDWDYAIGDNGFGLALGAKMGRSFGSIGGTSLSSGLAGAAHADFGYSHGRFGGLATVAFQSDRGTMDDDTEASFGGLGVGLVGQAVIIPRISTHLGVSRLLWSSVSIGETSSDVSGWSFEPGVDLTAYRGEKNEFIFRVDVRHTRSSDAMIGTTDASWVSTALLGEIVWVSTP